MLCRSQLSLLARKGKKVTCLTFPFLSTAYPHLYGHFQVTQVTQPEQVGSIVACIDPSLPHLPHLRVTQFPSRGQGTSCRGTAALLRCAIVSRRIGGTCLAKHAPDAGGTSRRGSVLRHTAAEGIRSRVRSLPTLGSSSPSEHVLRVDSGRHCLAVRLRSEIATVMSVFPCPGTLLHLLLIWVEPVAPGAVKQLSLHAQHSQG